MKAKDMCLHAFFESEDIVERKKRLKRGEESHCREVKKWRVTGEEPGRKATQERRMHRDMSTGAL